MDPKQQLSWEIAAQKQLIEIFKTSFDEIWTTFPELIDKEHDGSRWEFFQKLLAATQMLPEVHTSLCSNITSQIQKSASTILKLLIVSDNDVVKSPDIITNLLKILQISNEIYDFFTQKKSTYFGNIAASNLLYQDLIEFLICPRGKELEKGIYIRFLLTSKKIWAYLKSRSSERHVVQVLASVIKNKKTELFKDNPNASHFLRFSTELLKNSEESVDWKSILIQNEGKDEFLTILIPLIEIDPGIVDSKIIRQVRERLNSTDPERRKEAAVIIKYMSSNDNDSGDSSTEMLRHYSQNKFINFWSSYFDLYEILDEKQWHIVQPVLDSKLGIFDDPDTLTCSWYFVILSKMIHHDNRYIVKEGLLRFMNNRVKDDEENGLKKRRDMFETFLNTEVLPVLKEHAGWILPEPQEFFQTVEIFGGFLNRLYEDDEILMVDRVLTFIMQENKCLGACSLYFLIQSLHQGINLCNGIKEELYYLYDQEVGLYGEEDRHMTEAEQFENCVALITQFTSNGLKNVDKFLKFQVEETLVDILHRWEPVLQKISEFEIACTGISRNLNNVFNFIGSLSQISVFDNQKTRIKLGNLERKVIETNKENKRSVSMILNFRLQRFDGFSFSPLELKGISRWMSINALEKPEMCKEMIKQTIDQISSTETRESKKYLEYTSARMDFFQGLCKSIDLSNGNYGQLIKEIFDMLKLECINRITFVPKPGESPLIIFERFRSNLNVVKNILSHFGQHITLPENLVSVVSFPDEFLNEYLIVSLDQLKVVSIYSVTWSAIGLLPDEYDTLFVEKSIHKFSLTGFDELISTFSTSENHADLSFSKSGYYKVKFDTLASVLERRKEKKLGSLEMWKKCIVSGMDHIEKAGPGGVISATKFFKAVLPFLEEYLDGDNKDVIWELVNGMTEIVWKLVFEMRRSEFFWTGISEFVDLIIQPFFASRGVLTKFSEKIFQEGETITGLPLSLIQALADKLKKTDLALIHNEEMDEIIQVCLTAVSFGPPLIKANKVSFGLWAYLNSKEEVDVLQDESTFGSNAKTRVIGVWLLQHILTVLDDPGKKKILTVLLDRSDQETRKRYYGNSQTHRIKQRIAQTILMLQPYFNLEISQIVLERLLDSLTVDSPQPSVRYLCEWTIVKMLLKYPELWELFFENSIKCCAKRIGFGAFFSTICLHTSNLIESAEGVFFFKESLSALAELILGHHVAVRVYAQACFREIYNRADQKGYTLLKKKYTVFQEALDATSKNPVGNFRKLFEAVSKDFYLQIFNADTHYIPEVIFIYLPRLSEMTEDELPLESYLKFEEPFCNMSSGDVKQELKLMYKKYENLAWHLKATADGRELGEELPETSVLEKQQILPTEDSSSSVNFQKKINPWKSLSIGDEMDEFNLKFLTKKRSAMEDGLIIVASLIDKVPNLGGLCRSAEIFGVSKYVIPSLKVLQDQNFISLSVSAHNWVDILEVPPRDLEAFISSYAAKGYTILGIEQALESTRLNDFKFPRKSLLLLGNEKFGIPNNLLHLVDQCLEIPQVGITRSLNVHVTGALCIWQYAAQHSFT